jgi:hypothetical protein
LRSVGSLGFCDDTRAFRRYAITFVTTKTWIHIVLILQEITISFSNKR